MSLKLKIRSMFPALVSVTSPLLLVKTGLAYAFSFDVSALLTSLDPLYTKISNNLSDLAFKYTAKDNISIHGADIASAATVNLETATGDLVDVTGATTITAITLNEGHERTVRFTGILTLTNGASLVLPSGASITTAAGDFAIFRGYAAGVVRCIGYQKASGAAIVAGAGVSSIAGNTGAFTLSTGITNSANDIRLNVGQLPGEPSTGNASAGNVGEYIESSIAGASRVALVSGTAKTIASISLTAGDWDVDIMGYILPAATTTTTIAQLSISGTTNTMDFTPGKWNSLTTSSSTFTPNNEIGLAIPPYRLSLAATTTVFFVASSTFATSTSAVYGLIRARRVR